MAQGLALAEASLQEQPSLGSSENFLSWLNQNFLQKDPLSLEHLSLWLNLKVWLVGGDPQKLTAQELRSLRTMISAWQIFLQSSREHLSSLLVTDRATSSQNLKRAYQNLKPQVARLLQSYPHLINNFDFKAFVNLNYQNKSYHNISNEAFDTSLMGALVWFANGNSETLIFKKTTEFMLDSIYQYKKFQVEVGTSLPEVLFSGHRLFAYFDELAEMVDPWMEELGVLPLTGFDYLADYISQNYFSGEVDPDDIHRFMETMVTTYLSEPGDPYVEGIGINQWLLVKKQMSILSTQMSRLQSVALPISSLDPDLSWLESMMSPFSLFRIDLQSNLQISLLEEGPSSVEAYKAMLLLTYPVRLAIQVRGRHFLNQLTREEFDQVLSDFSLFQRFWQMDVVAEGVAVDNFARAKTTISISPYVDEVQLFYFMTYQLQGKNLKNRLLGIAPHP